MRCSTSSNSPTNGVCISAVSTVPAGISGRDISGVISNVHTLVAGKIAAYCCNSSAACGLPTMKACGSTNT